MTITGGSIVANRYRLRRFLGRGAFGEVWEAEDQHRGHTVAIKFLGHRNRTLAWREASLLTALESPYILKVNNADVVVDVPYLDTALADCSVDKMSEPYGIEPRRAVDWIRRALRGLDLCHRRHLLHRDVKPANIFLIKPDEIRLGDFGVAALMDANGTADPGGDPRIMAPELFTGSRASVASDIYSAAVTLYALLAGRNPFAQIKVQADLQAAIVQGNYPALRDVAPHVSVALAAKVRTGMNVDPTRRYASATAFDGQLVLPRRDRQFEPASPHAGHLRCWDVSGRGAAMSVCVTSNASGQFDVETKRVSAGTKVRKHCFSSRASQLSKDLRKVFNDFR